jgi:ketosteroid isomerase-like protein
MIRDQSRDSAPLHTLRTKWALAEATGDLEYFEQVLAEDAVIMPPGAGVVEGKAACMEFIRGVASDLAQDFDREITLTSHETDVNGTWAFDRGVFTQLLVRRVSGQKLIETGKYFWLFQRVEGQWRLARLIGNHDWPEGSEEGDSAGA